MKLISQPCLSPLRDVYAAYFTVRMNRGATSRKTIAILLTTETEWKNALYKDMLQDTDHRPAPLPILPRSEERRVGKEGTARGKPGHARRNDTEKECGN